MKSQFSTKLIYLMPILIGISIFYLVIGPAVLDPRYISWIQDGDPAQQYLGWTLFRQSPWQIPFGLNPNFGMDIGSSIVYSDSIPLAAIFFKALSPLLSEPFQYFGWWTLLCFVLQAYFAWLLARLITKELLQQWLITGLITFSLPMLWRVAFHHYLLAQFLILAGLYCNFTKPLQWHKSLWILLLSVAVLTNFYVFVMVLVLWVGNACDCMRRGQVAVRTLCFEILLSSLFLIGVMWLAGYFTVGSNNSFGSGMYGYSRLNLIALIDANGWSWLIRTLSPTLPSFAGNNYESFHFLGMGGLILAMCALWKIRASKTVLLQQILCYRYLLFFISGLSLFAITNWVSVGPYSIHVLIPEFLFSLATVLRSSGRMFLPMFYLLFLAILYLVTLSYSKSIATTLLATALLIQVVDSAPAWIVKRRYLAQTYENLNSSDFATPLHNPFWQSAAKHYKNVVTIFTPPKKGFIPPNWAPFAALAAQYHLATNSVYLARFDEKKAVQARLTLEADSNAGQYHDDTLYIIGDERVIPTLIHLDRSRDLFARIDNFNVLAPGWFSCATCVSVPKEAIISMSIPPIQKGQNISFGKGGVGSLFLIGVNTYDNVGYGWAWPEAWGVWSEGNKAQFVLPLPSSGVTNTLTLTMRALVSKQHPQQIIEVYVNNVLFRVVTLTDPSKNSIEIPITSAITQAGFIQIELKFQNPIRPKDLGMGDDGRLVAIGLEDARFE